MRIALMLIYILLVMAVRIRVTISQEGFASLPCGHLYITLWGVGPLLRWQLLVRCGRAFLCLSWRKFNMKIPIRRRHAYPAKRLHARTSFLARIKSILLHMLRRALRIRVTVAIGLSDAAHTALACGAILAMLGLIPCVRVRTLPQYAQTPSLYLHADCILSAKMGKLLLMAALSAFYARQKAGGARNGRVYSSDRRRYANGA